MTEPMDVVDQRQQMEIKDLQGRDAIHDELIGTLRDDLKFTRNFSVGMVVVQFFLIIITWGLLLLSGAGIEK